MAGNIEIGARVVRQFPRFGMRPLNGKLTRVVVKRVDRIGEVTALDHDLNPPMARIRFDGGLITWEPIEMLRIMG